MLMMGLVPLAFGAAACSETEAEPGKAAAVDSVIPREESLRRFRLGLDSVDALTGSAASRDQLVRRFVRALETRDTAALRTLLMTKAEFAWVYYPTNPQGLPPYDLEPGLLWFLVDSRSRQGISAALEERAGRPLGFAGYSCDPVPSREGANTVVGPCLVHRVQAPGDTVKERLFGPIIERGGRYKFVSYANKL
jgi:hypothetical protein